MAAIGGLNALGARRRPGSGRRRRGNLRRLRAVAVTVEQERHGDDRDDQDDDDRPESTLDEVTAERAHDDPPGPAAVEAGAYW
jgi:hypothetical protein